jgi:hypothetical protein
MRFELLENASLMATALTFRSSDIFSKIKVKYADSFLFPLLGTGDK